MKALNGCAAESSGGPSDAQPAEPQELVAVHMYATGRFADLHAVAFDVDENFDSALAVEFLEQHGEWSEDENDALGWDDKQSSYQEYAGWSPRQKKLLDTENARRKELRRAWCERAAEIATLLSALGGAVVVAAGGAWKNDAWGPSGEEMWQPVVLCAALPERLLDELLAFIRTIIGADADYHVERYPGGATTSMRFDEPAVEYLDDYGGIEFFSSAPKEGETWVELARRQPIDEARFRTIQKAYRCSNGNIETFSALMRAHSGRGATVEFVIDRLFPRETVAILIGPPKIGKSTLALQAAVDVADGAPFLGLPTRPGGDDTFVVFLSGEDSQGIVETRLWKLSVRGQNDRLLPIYDPLPLLEALELLEPLSVDFLVVDTAAEFVGASVNDGGPVREFMSALANFAKRKNCAVLVIHHTNKNKSTSSSKATATNMKGSSEFTSAARVILTMHQQGERNFLSVHQHNMPSSVPMLEGPLRLVYDPATERHDLDDQARPQAIGDGQGSDDVEQQRRDAETVAAVVHKAREDGQTVALSGKNEVYNLGAPELAGWPRARVRAAHRHALSAGLLDEASPAVDAAE